MAKKSTNISHSLYPVAFIALLVALWQLACSLQLVPAFMLPSPAAVLAALWHDLPLLAGHAKISLTESFWGLGLSILFAAFLAIIMDASALIRKTLYPLLIITQTVPTIAIAPLLVLWLGYGMAPKITLIFISCFFPLVINILTGLASVDEDTLRLFRSMGAKPWQMLLWVKLPSAIPHFFAGLRVAVSYAIVGAVIAEWLGGNGGLGVYMTRVRKSFAFDKMFAVIIVVSLISLILIKLVDIIEKKSTPWRDAK